MHAQYTLPKTATRTAISVDLPPYFLRLGDLSAAGERARILYNRETTVHDITSVLSSDTGNKDVATAAEEEEKEEASKSAS